MVEKKDFFSLRNTIYEIPTMDEKQFETYLKSLEAFARTTYSSAYVIDYYKQEFDYVSENSLFLCGHTAQEVKSMGYSFYFSYVIDEDIELLKRINQIGFEFFEKIHEEERQFYTISYDFHLQDKRGHTFLVNHKLTPIFLTESGKIWKALCVVSLSNSKEAGNIRIYRQYSNRFWRYDLQGRFWNSEERIKLSEREYDILLFSIQGYTINEIAEKLFISASTIKFHRKNLFEKLHVANMTEALTFATNNKLI